MGRTIRTVPIPESKYGPGYYHRTHRSRKGQKKRVMDQMKTVRFEFAAKRDKAKTEKFVRVRIKKLLYR